MISRLSVLVSSVVLALATPLFAQISEEGMKTENIEMMQMERPVIEYVLLVIFPACGPGRRLLYQQANE